jgi:hypothetical protein
MQKDQKINQLAKQNLNTIGKFELDNISVISSYLDDKDQNNESEIYSEDNTVLKKTPPKKLLTQSQKSIINQEKKSAKKDSGSRVLNFHQ